MTFIQSPLEIKGGQEMIDRMLEKYGLNDPIYIQYGRWIRNVFRGDFGWSSSAQEPAAQAIAHRFPATLELVLIAVFPILAGGVLLGVVSAIYHNSCIDQITRLTSIFGWSMPTFLLALVILIVFYGFTGWLLPGRLSIWAEAEVSSVEFARYTGMNILDGVLNGNWRIAADALRHVLMPVLTLILIDWAVLCRITRSSMLEALHQDYVTTARSKGLRERVVVLQHALRNALLPTVTVGGMMVAWLLSGVVITETVFDYPGVGQFAASAALHLDFPGILGFALFFGTIIVSINLVVDLLYAYLDPRIRLE